MLSKFTSATVLSLLIVSALTAQTIRFDTNVGNFDLELNPTGNPNLQPHVDNILAYVNAGRYDLTVINRAHTDFVMQMGGFLAETLTIPNAFSDFDEVVKFDPVVVDANLDNQVDFDVSSLTNTPGTVSLALSNSPNTGTSSFFVNLDNNTSLDSDSLRFVPFARISDMATINLIMSLDQHNYTDGGLAGDNVPVLSGQRMVFVEKAYVLDQPDVQTTIAAMAQDGSQDEQTSSVQSASLAPAVVSPAVTVPEPSSIVLAALALLAASASKRRLRS